MTAFLVLLVALLVAIYTFNYARWAWRQRLRLGAFGLALLAAATVAVPAWVMWYLS
ncbi:MAG: hypothetical protein AB2385_01770 [Symbiobacterium sp.]|uniref:hypothetical protein n=1 Tax=Symbiobacterium sp. TaxID=1971213 RepID=UPI003463EC95